MRAVAFWLLAVVLIFAGNACAQNTPAAKTLVNLSAFGLLGDNYTGLSQPVTNLGGRNVIATLGLDARLHDHGRVALDAEVRGSYPAYNGKVDGQKAILAGARVRYRSVRFSTDRLQPYFDVLAGCGAIHYVSGGYPTGDLLYLRSVSTVYSIGGGVEYALTPRWSLRGNIQGQHWNTPVIASGTILSVQGSAGVVFALRSGRDRAH